MIGRPRAFQKVPQQDDLVIVITSPQREPLVTGADSDGLLYLLTSLISPSGWEILECDDDGESLMIQAAATRTNLSLAGLLVVADIAFPEVVTKATQIEIRTAPLESLSIPVRLGERIPLNPILHARTPLAWGLRIDAALTSEKTLPLQVE